MSIHFGLSPSSTPSHPTLVPDRVDHAALSDYLREWDACSTPGEGQDPCDRIRPGAHVPVIQRLRSSQRAPLARPEDTRLPGERRHGPRIRQNSDALRLAEIEAVTSLPQVQAATAALLDRMTMPTGLRGWWRHRFGPKVESVETLASRLVDALRAACEQRKRAGEVTVFRHIEQAVDAMAASLVKQAAVATSAKGRSRWCQRVESQRAGSFLAAVRAQQRRSVGPNFSPSPEALLELDSPLSRLLSCIRSQVRET